MIQYTLENIFIMYLFETLLGGLIFLVLLWEYAFQPPDEKKSSLWLTAALLCFCGSMLGKSLLSLALSAGTQPTGLWLLAVLAASLEVVFALLLLLSFSGHRGHANPTRRFFASGLSMIFLTTPLREGFDTPLQILEQLSPDVINGLLMGVLFLALFFNSRRGSLIHVGVALFTVSYLCGAMHILYFYPACWNAQHLAKLSGLLFFALHLEREQSHIFAQFFMRLNLVFILSASVFMLILADTERKNYLRLSAANVQDLAEFIRGHAIYYLQRGESPAAVLKKEQINHKVTSEFGRIPDLKEVKVDLLGSQLRMAIDDDGLISYETGRGLFAVDSEIIDDFQRNTVTILRVPIMAQGEKLGLVELADDAFSLTARISGQMRFIFATFTVIVLITLLSLGLIVVRAHRIIRRQYRSLDKTTRELMEASHLAAIGRLIDGVAHEINNPAGVILIRAECAMSPAASPESVTEDLGEIRSQATRMAKIVRNLLAFSRPNPLRIVPTDLNQVIGRSLTLLDSYQQMTGIQTHLALEPSLPPISGDPDRLEQVIINIGRNAVDAMPEGGRLSISTRVDDDFAVVRIEDTGVGMSAETAERISAPFFSTRRIGEGVGLGMTISFRIVQEHQGHIEVQSKPGAGTAVSVFLPLRRSGQ